MNALLAAQTDRPPRRCSMILGVPARVVRPLTEAERGHPRVACDIYLRLVEWHRSGKWRVPG